jgi:monoamine oxidase
MQQGNSTKLRRSQNSTKAHDPPDLRKAVDLYTSTDADMAPLYAHPIYGLPQAMHGLWDGTLHFAGTEVALSSVVI